MCSVTRTTFAGGFAPSASNVIDYLTTTTSGDTTDFGDLTVARASANASASSGTRGLCAGGHNPTYTNVIDYITIASTGNATDFGDLTAAMGKSSGASTSVRAVFFAGQAPLLSPAENPTDRMEYVTIASTGDTTDFGDLYRAIKHASSSSDSNGGLQ